MDHSINKVAVLGAGTMGAQIAGHFSNAGIPSLLFDINIELATKGVETLTALRPAPLYTPKNTNLIDACTYDKDLEKIKDALSEMEKKGCMCDRKLFIEYQNITESKNFNKLEKYLIIKKIF